MIRVVEVRDDDGTPVGCLIFIPKYPKILACAVWPSGVHHGKKEFAREGDAREWIKKKAREDSER